MICRPLSLGDCEWSSLKEVWAWVIRTKARKKIESFPEALVTPKRKGEHAQRQAPSRSKDETEELLALADAVEHTDIGDAWLAGDGRVPDLPLNFLADYWAQVDDEKQQSGSSKSKKLHAPARSVFPVSREVVLAALEAVEVPENKSRGNVRQEPDQILEAMCLGAVSARGAGVQASVSTRDRPRLTRLLVQFATDRRRLRLRRPKTDACLGAEFFDDDKEYDEVSDCETTEDKFYFTSIQVNKNYASAIHVDRNNYGPSLIIGLGPFEGAFDDYIL